LTTDSSTSHGAEPRNAAVTSKKQKNYEVKLAAPGYDKKILAYRSTTGCYRSCGKREEKRKEEDSYARRVFASGSFSRSFNLPPTPMKSTSTPNSRWV